MIVFLAGCFALVLIEYVAVSAGQAPATLGMSAEVQFRQIQGNVLPAIRAASGGLSW